MNCTKSRLVSAFALAALAAVILSAAESRRFYVTAPASGLVKLGIAAAAPIDPLQAGFQEVPAPGVRMVQNEAQATTAPWIDSNGWRFQRGVQKAYYAKLPAGSAPLAAAEAFAFNVDAVINPDPADLDELGRMLQFLNAQTQTQLPVMANIGVVDNKTPLMGELLNLLTRRNLLYRVVAAPDPSLDLTVQLGSADFPKESASNPSDFAARVRAKLGDDKRLVRLYGTSSVVARLVGDGKQARLYLLSYGGRRGGGGGGGGAGEARNQQAQGIRVRVLGRYEPVRLAAYGASPDAELIDVDNPGNAIEFSMPTFTTIAIVDLKEARQTLQH